MNKIALFGAMALGLFAFASCDGYEEPNPQPQTNPEQEVFMSVKGLKIAAPVATATKVVLADFVSDSRATATTGGNHGSNPGGGDNPTVEPVNIENAVPVLQLEDLSNWPEQYTLTGEMQYSKTDAFEAATTRTIPLFFDPETEALYARVDDWQTAHVELFSANPEPQDAYVRFALYGEYLKSKVRIGTEPDTWYGERMVNVTPLTTYIVEKEYTIIGTQNVAMTAQNPDNVYDPPVFSGAFEVVEGGFDWQIQSASGKVYGPADPTAAEGKLVEGAAAGKITDIGPRKIEINLEKMTYTISSAIPYLYAYTATPTAGWPMGTNDFINYGGFANINRSTFRLASEKTASPALRWGALLGEDEVAVPKALALVDDPTQAPAGIAVETRGCYYIKANILKLTYSTDYCGSFSLIGGFNDTSWGQDIVLTPSSNNMVWTGTATIENDGFEFKIRTNCDWDGVDLGGSPESLVEHGGNMTWNYGPGTFAITLDLSQVPYTLTVTPAN